MLDNSGAVVVKYVYTAWGDSKVLSSDGRELTDETHIGNLNPYRYRGYYYDVETGLYYLKTRYYDPQTCRFVTIDDLQYLDPETINGLNLYAYCANNPILYVDPNGTSILFAIFIGIVIGAAVLGTGYAVYSGIKAYNEGARGWELAGAIGKGFIKGAVIGGVIGGFVGALIYLLPMMGSFFGSSVTLGSYVTASGEVVAISVTGAQIAAAAATAAFAGMGILYSKGANRNQPKDKRSNSFQNKEFDYLCKKYGLNYEQRERLHRKISKKGFDKEIIIEFIKKLFPYLFK